MQLQAKKCWECHLILIISPSINRDAPLIQTLHTQVEEEQGENGCQKRKLEEKNEKRDSGFLCVLKIRKTGRQKERKICKAAFEKKTGNHKNQMNFLCSRKYKRRIRNISKMFSGSELKCNSLSFAMLLHWDNYNIVKAEKMLNGIILLFNTAFCHIFYFRMRSDLEAVMRCWQRSRSSWSPCCRCCSSSSSRRRRRPSCCRFVDVLNDVESLFRVPTRTHI